MSRSERGRDQALIPLRSAVICMIAYQLALVVGVLTYFVHRDPATALLAGGAAFSLAFTRLNGLIG